MTYQFKLTNLSNNTYAVSWENIKGVRHLDSKLKLLAMVYDDIGTYQAGFWTKDCNGNEVTIWLDAIVYFQTSTRNFILNGYDEISGVVFRKLSEAELFKEKLEQKLTWHLLKT